MKASVLLAEAAQNDTGNGKVHALGIGWSSTTSPAGPMAVIAVVTFDGSEHAEGEHDLSLTLLDDHDEPVAIGRDAQPMIVTTTLVLNQNDELRPGMEAIATFAINIGPGLPLAPGRRYRWQLRIDDDTHEDWAAAFATRPASDPTQ